MRRARGVVLALAGERVYRLTMANLRHDEEEVAAVLHEILVAPGKAHPPLAG